MAITSLESYLSKKKHTVSYTKTAALTIVAGVGYDPIATGGVPAAGALAGTDAVAGTLQTVATAGYIKGLPQSPNGNLIVTGVDFAANVTDQTMFHFYDFIWKAGPYAFNASQALSGQPDISGRVPNGDYRDIQLFFNVSVLFAGMPTYTITYTNQDGVAGRTCVASGAAAMPVAQCRRVPLQEGDTGIQSIQNIVGSVATAGSANFILARYLFSACNKRTCSGNKTSIIETNALIYPTSAIQPLAYGYTTSISTYNVNLEVREDG